MRFHRLDYIKRDGIQWNSFCHIPSSTLISLTSQIGGMGWNNKLTFIKFLNLLLWPLKLYPATLGFLPKPRCCNSLFLTNYFWNTAINSKYCIIHPKVIHNSWKRSLNNTINENKISKGMKFLSLSLPFYYVPFHCLSSIQTYPKCQTFLMFFLISDWLIV